MTRMFTRLALAACMTLVLHTNARAADAAGDWNGVIGGQSGGLRLVLHVKKASNGGYSALLDSPDQGAAGIPVDSVTEKDGTLIFSLARIRASYEGKWDAATKTWIGTFTQGQAQPLTLAQGTVGAPSVTAIKGIGADLDGTWNGSLTLPSAAVVTVIYHIKTTAAGTSATMDVVEQNARGVPVSGITRDGAKIKLEMKSLGANFEGTLAADKKTISGTFSQRGAAIPLELKIAGK